MKEWSEAEKKSTTAFCHFYLRPMVFCGSKDVFSVSFHTNSSKFIHNTFQVCMVYIDGAGGAFIATTLDIIVHRSWIEQKKLSCVYDGGYNLIKCHQHIIGKLSCEIIGYISPATINFPAHKLIKDMSKSISGDEVRSVRTPLFYLFIKIHNEI